MAKNKLERIEAYRCSICRKVVVGKSKMEKHMTIPIRVLPVGLIFLTRTTTGGPTEGWSGSDPYVTHEYYRVIVSSHFKQNPDYSEKGEDNDNHDGSHNSQNLAYVLGSGEYSSSSYRSHSGISSEIYRANGRVHGIDWSEFKAFLGEERSTPQIHLLKPEEFEKVVMQLKNADTRMVKKELEFLNQPYGSQGRWIVEPGYAYRRENPSNPAARIDRLVLKRKYHLPPEKLIRTTPSLERLALDMSKR